MALARRWGTVGLRVHQLLEFIWHSDWKYIPYVWAAPLENLVQRAAPTAQPILSSWWAYNYFFATISPAVVELEEWLGIGPPLCPLLPVLGTPYAEKGNALLHSILAHEVGHLALDQHPVQLPAPELTSDALGSLSGEPLTAPQAPPGSLFEHTLRESLTGEFSRAFRAWAQEIVADLFALQMLGPAYFFAFSFLGVSADMLSEPDRSQPPLGVRCRALLRAVEAWGHLGALPQPLQQVVLQWKTFGWEAPQLARVHQLVQDSLEQHLDALIEAVNGAAESLGLAYSSEAYRRDVEALRNRILDGVPPDTIGTVPYHAVSLAAILNAAWEVRLAYLPELQRLVAGDKFDPEDANQRSQALGVLNRLTTKAIEYHAIATQWEKARARTEG